MGHRIAQLLDEPEQQVAKLIDQLESKNGYPSHDVRLLADSIQKIRRKITDLGLDPDDTTGEELYHALQSRFERDSSVFDQEYGAASLGFDQKSVLAARILEEKTELPRQWGLKKTAAKKILHQHPPKHVMKQLRYRSVESLLKRANFCEIFLAAQVAESATWLKEQNRLVSHLDQMDFELRPLKLVTLKSETWSDYEADNYMVVDNSVGAIGLWPSSELRDAPLLSIMVLLLDIIESYHDFKIGQAVASLNPTAVWWADMDHLVANLSGEHVSLSLKDCAVNFVHDLAYDERQLAHAQKTFWNELVSHYENRAADNLDFSAVKKLAGWQNKVPEPAFEFAEDI